MCISFLHSYVSYECHLFLLYSSDFTENILKIVKCLSLMRELILPCCFIYLRFSSYLSILHSLLIYLSLFHSLFIYLSIYFPLSSYLSFLFFFNQNHPKQGRNATKSQGVTGYGRIREGNINDEPKEKRVIGWAVDSN